MARTSKRSPPPPDPKRALGAYPGFEAATVEPVAGGLIHRTYAVQRDGEEYILQRVNGIFSPAIHENILAVTEHLRSKGVATFRLLPSRSGEVWSDPGDGCVWRLMTRVPGVSFPRCGSPEQARAAGGLVASFHSALADLRYAFRPLGTPLHDTPAHLAALRRALRAQLEHPFHSDVARLAGELFAVAARWEALDALPRRIVHGDLKFNNVLFAGPRGPEACRAQSLIDLDTVSRMPLYVELGDAWRSWCNTGGEDEERACLDLGIFEASARGYLDALSFPLEAEEQASLVHGLERISLELTARFAADTLNESYFAWDASRFSSAAEHNWVRARGQWSLHRQALETRATRARVLAG